MKILQRYIGRTVISSIMVVLLVLIGIQSFIVLTAQLQDVGKGDYSWLHAFAFVPLILPSDLYQLFPMAALVGSVLGLGRLATSSELIVMRTSGMSKWQVVRGVLFAAFALLVIVSIIGEGLAPYARDYALRMKSIALSRGQSLHTPLGTWVRDHHQFLHVKKIISVDELEGVTRYQFSDQHQLLQASYAARGVLQQGQWVFYDVQESQFKPSQVLSHHYPQQTWSIQMKTDEFIDGAVDPHQQTLLTLYHYLHFRRHSGLGVGQFAFTFWQRVFQPLASLVMILFAIPVIFGPLGRVSMGLRLLSGVMLGFGFFILNQFLGPFSLVFQVPPVLAAALPTLLFAFMATFLLKFRV